MIRTALRLLLAAAVLLPAAWAEEAAVTRRPVQLRDAPGDQARALASLPAQAPVTRTDARQGPWVQVRTADDASGWVHLFDLGPAATEASAGGLASGALRGVTSLFGGSRTPATATASSGIRGLGAEDIAQAQPNPAAVTRMEAQRQGEAEVRSFAGRAGWHAAAVDPLPQPARAAGPSHTPPGQPRSP